MRILAVEAERHCCDNLCAALAAQGHELAGCVASLEEAWDLVDAGAFDAALIAVQVHGQETYPMAACIRAAGKPLAFLSSAASVRLPAPLTGSLVLKKPFAPHELNVVMKLLVDESSNQSSPQVCFST